MSAMSAACMTGSGVSVFCAAKTAKHLELSEGVGVVSQAQRVEGLSRVHLVQTLSSRSTVHTVSLNSSHEDDLHHVTSTSATLLLSSLLCEA